MARDSCPAQIHPPVRTAGSRPAVPTLGHSARQAGGSAESYKENHRGSRQRQVYTRKQAFNETVLRKVDTARFAVAERQRRSKRLSVGEGAKGRPCTAPRSPTQPSQRKTRRPPPRHGRKQCAQRQKPGSKSCAFRPRGLPGAGTSVGTDGRRVVAGGRGKRRWRRAPRGSISFWVPRMSRSRRRRTH